ncbi:MAG: hypothetical protein ACK53C_13885 [Pseudomonadota bacterium]
MSESVKLPTVAKGDRPWYFDDAEVEKVLDVTLALAGEVAVLYTRLRALERLVEQHGLLQPGAVDAFRPSDDDARALDEWRANFIRSVLRPIRTDRERTRAPESYDGNMRMTETG